MEYIVEFKGNRRQAYSAPDDLSVEVGKYVIVQAERGEDMGKVTRKAVPADIQEGVEIQKIIRLAAPNDLERLKFNRQKEEESFNECLKFIEKHQLKMKLVDVEYQYDCNKITFYFTAEKRVDFRELVKDLAATFRTRIELRQIGSAMRPSDWAVTAYAESNNVVHVFCRNSRQFPLRWRGCKIWR
jgi:cell fate regulator YaaT (PSP1 superfamily)